MKCHCDECIAKAVLQKKVRPLNAVWGNNKAPFERNVVCFTCGKKSGNHEGFWLHPEMDRIKNDENEI